MDLSNIVYRCQRIVVVFLLSSVFLTSSSSAQGLSVDLTTNTGATQTGTLAAVTETGIEIDQSGEAVSIDNTELMSMEFKSVEKRSSPSTRVLLVNGSQLVVDEVQIDRNQITIEPRRQASLQLPLSQVKAIRFRRPSAVTDPVWLGMLETPSRGDRMVIRRSNDRLDPTDGIINGIADSKVDFDLDGDAISAPIDRLEGLIFGGTDPTQGSSGVVISDAYGSTWAADALLPVRLDQPAADQGMRFQLPGNVFHTIPIDLVRSVRWSSGLVMLAEAKPAELNVQTEFAIDWKDDASKKWFGPLAVKANKASAAQPNQDLMLCGGSEVEYRVEEGFRLLSGSVRRASEIKNASSVTVRIKLDDKLVWENDLPNADSLGFELELGEARRIKIEIDSGDDGDLGAMVRMVRPRFVK
ncbi:hypothetical protein LF1_04340 [Rubripirellula obstinata]|uniref:NPCBM/NEW2 domain protein n=1 Tax=Rubripirellula obstinata TaxID=406547 RepID=A0A5B1CEQ8_9BACT|nr:hypothetical protein [Rubripirellula obstinata]KAA1257943.1 hypothetical protein LF1_04340 [Rubripirellula obstinata]